MRNKSDEDDDIPCNSDTTNNDSHVAGDVESANHDNAVEPKYSSF